MEKTMEERIAFLEKANGEMVRRIMRLSAQIGDLVDVAAASAPAPAEKKDAASEYAPKVMFAMKLVELQEVAKSLGIDGYEGMKRPELMTAIKAKREATA